MKSSDQILPKGFEDLELWVGKWAKIKEGDRRAQRDVSSLDEIKSFYGSVVERVDAMLDYLNTKDMDKFEDSDDRLFALTLSLAEVASAVEWYNQVRVIDGIEPSRYKVDADVRKRYSRKASEEKWV